MLDSVLRVYGEEFDVDAFLALCTLTVPTEVFRKGEADMLGNPNAESGFDALISDNMAVTEHFNEVQSFLKLNEIFFLNLKDTHAHCVIDIGFTAVSEDQFTQCIKLPPELLGVLHQLNIAVELSVYSDADM